MAAATTSLKLDPELKERIDRLAQATERSSHWLMKRAIEEFVAREEEEVELRTELLRRSQEYEVTGRHVTSDEAKSWLSALARGEKRPRPKPHR